MGVTYLEWKAACDLALCMLCTLLQYADTSPDLVQFISNHDVDTAVQKDFCADDLWWVDVNILAFLSVSPFLESVFCYWFINCCSIHLIAGKCVRQLEDNIRDTAISGYNGYVRQNNLRHLVMIFRVYFRTTAIRISNIRGDTL